jgi:hypothetical protein
MCSLNLRLKRLEAAAGKVHLATLSDADLDAHILTLMAGSPGWYDGIIHRVLRYPSTLPVICDDPDHLVDGGGEASE